MKFSKTGFKTLALYIALSLFTWIAADFLPNDIGVALLVITSILLIILWHEKIRSSMESRIKDGVLISLFFIVPYVITVMIAYDALFNEEFSIIGIMGYQIWTIFSNPMRLIPQGIYAEHNIFFILEPVLIMTILVIVNIVNLKLNKI